jgi:hypothetical protein
MSYIGSTPTTQSFIAGTDYFNGNGSTVNFTLSRSVNSVNDIEVIVNNVEQIPSGYSVSGTTLTFSAAPSAGTSNVYVRYLSTTNLSLAIPAGTSATFNTVTVADGSATTPSITNDGDTNTGIFFPAADTIAFAEGGAEVARFDSAGNFGIGGAATNEGGYARVLQVTGSTEAALELKTGSDYSYVAQNGTTLQIRNNAPAGAMTFATEGTERARITDAGFFKASSTGSYLNPTGSQHEFRSAGANNYELIISNTNASPASQYMQDIRFTAATPNNTNARFLACTDPTNEKAAILSTGGFLSRNNSYGTYSDIKLKENVVDASPKLDDVMRLQVRNFNFKTNPETKQIGFIAQEFEQVFPAMVDESQDRGKDGAVLEQTTKSIKTSVLIPILVKAIQEQQALITALTTRITALENNNATQ